MTSSSIIIYNLYTSTILSAILKSSWKIPSTLDELLKSPLQIHFDDVILMTRFFKMHSTNKTIKEIVKKNQQGNGLQIFLNPETGIKQVKESNIAFYCESMVSYALLAKTLNPQEICQLRQVKDTFIIDNFFLQLVVSEDSQYIEMLRYGFIRAREVGLIKRDLLIYRIPKPVCQSTSPMELVNIQEVISVFYFLGIALFISFSIFGFEILYKALKTRSSRNLNK